MFLLNMQEGIHCLIKLTFHCVYLSGIFMSMSIKLREHSGKYHKTIDQGRHHKTNKPSKNLNVKFREQISRYCRTISPTHCQGYAVFEIVN